jgi:hypothetical protein
VVGPEQAGLVILAHLATSPEARFQTIVTLIGGTVLILGAVGGIVWRMSLWIKRQADATRANTEALVGSARGGPGLIETVAGIQQAIEDLTLEIHAAAGPGRRYRGRH